MTERAVDGGGLTPNQRLKQLLQVRRWSLRELSAELHLTEKDVAALLEAMSQRAGKAAGRLGVLPSQCLACGFQFGQRRRATRPSRCPQCRSERLTKPLFWLVIR